MHACVVTVITFCWHGKKRKLVNTCPSTAMSKKYTKVIDWELRPGLGRGRPAIDCLSPDRVRHLGMDLFWFQNVLRSELTKFGELQSNYTSTNATVDTISQFRLTLNQFAANWYLFIVCLNKINNLTDNALFQKSLLYRFIEIFYWHNPSGRTMALGLTQLLTEISTRNIS
jgi:hypothetical protein